MNGSIIFYLLYTIGSFEISDGPTYYCKHFANVFCQEGGGSIYRTVPTISIYICLVRRRAV